MVPASPAFMRPESYRVPFRKRLQLPSKNAALVHPSPQVSPVLKERIPPNTLFTRTFEEPNVPSSSNADTDTSQMAAVKKIIENRLRKTQHDEENHEESSKTESPQIQEKKQHRFIVTICDGKVTEILPYCADQDFDLVFTETVPPKVSENIATDNQLEDFVFPSSSEKGNDPTRPSSPPKKKPIPSNQKDRMQNKGCLQVPGDRRAAVSGSASPTGSEFSLETSNAAYHRRKALCSSTDK